MDIKESEISLEGFFCGMSSCHVFCALQKKSHPHPRQIYFLFHLTIQWEKPLPFLLRWGNLCKFTLITWNWQNVHQEGGLFIILLIFLWDSKWRQLFRLSIRSIYVDMNKKIFFQHWGVYFMALLLVSGFIVRIRNK